MEIPARFFAVEETGFKYYEITSRYVGSQLSILNALVKFVPRMINGLFDDGSVLAVSGEGVSLSRTIDHLMIHTYFKPIKDPKEKVIFIPVFMQPGDQMNLRWEPPKDMQLHVVAYWAGRDGINVTLPDIYLIALSSAKKTYLLPLPNLYNEGKLCLGHGIGDEFFAKTGMAQLEKAIGILQGSIWNSDLLAHVRTSSTEAMFRFDADGSQLPIEGDWKSMCDIINYPAYQHLGEINIDPVV